MKKLLTQGQLSVLIVFAVLIIDQIIKILVKTNMYWHESIRITDWFYIYFTENNGMAFGMKYSESYPYYLPYCSCGIDYLVSGKNSETEL